MPKLLHAVLRRLEGRRRYLSLLACLEQINAADSDDGVLNRPQTVKQMFGGRRR